MPISWSKIVGNVAAGILCRRHVLREAAHTIEDADESRGSAATALLERSLADAAGGEGVIGDDGRLLRCHQHQFGFENRVAVKRTELAAGVAANAERVLAADIEWQVSLQRVLVGRKKANHAAEMVVMTVTENERVKRRRIDLQDRHIVERELPAYSRNL